MPRHHPRDLSDAQWEILDPLIPDFPRRKDGRGRPPRDRREVLNGILYILRTGAPWADLPERYPPYQTCHRRFQHWVKSGVMRGVLEALAEDLRARWIRPAGSLYRRDIQSRKKGALESAKPSGARGPGSWQSQTAMVFLSPYARRVLRRMR